MLNIGDRVECFDCVPFFVGRVGIITYIAGMGAYVDFSEPKPYTGTKLAPNKSTYVLLSSLRRIKNIIVPLPLPG